MIKAVERLYAIVQYVLRIRSSPVMSALLYQMSGQKYLRTNFDDDDDHLVDSSPGAAVSGVSPVDGSTAGGGLDGSGRPQVSVYTTTVAFGGIDSGPAAVCRPVNSSWLVRPSVI